ncbi:MAG TPA: hypothetical protein VMB66_06555 [Candidatus Acidoferrales bacterium]|nr:hypothetical protein [Candidatus Acidoferrales bacterium]
MRRRIAISSLIGVAAGAFCFFLMRRLHQGAGDFGWTIHLAQRWLARQNPYDTPYEQYPFTAGLFGFPFAWAPREIAAGIFFGISSGLMAFGLAREGYHRLLVFLAYPYWIALLYVQWAPLVLASAFLPLILPVTMAKPQVGLPIFLTRLSKRGFWACVVVGLASLAMFPRWPMLWLGQLHNYEHFIALLVLPGPIILLALLRYRDRDAILLVLTACMPQRWFFDALILWLIPKTRREIIITVFLSWCAGIWRYYLPPHSFIEVGRLVVIFIYLPMLAIVLLRGRREWGARKTPLDKAKAAI